MLTYLNKYDNITKRYGGVAQLGEHLPCKQGVRSSNLLISTKGRRKTWRIDDRSRNTDGLVAQTVRAHA